MNRFFDSFYLAACASLVLLACGGGSSSSRADARPRTDAATPDANPTDAPPDAPVDEDIDNDGVLDVTDNCNRANPMQEDVDADGVGDLCDTEPVNLLGERLFVPVGATLQLAGDVCYRDVLIEGTVRVPPGGAGILAINADSIVVTGVIDANGSGAAGAPAGTSRGVGGHSATSMGGGCGGGPGASVGQGGAGGSHGGVGGTSSSLNSFATVCGTCDVPAEYHCRPEPGSLVGAVDGEDLSVGGGGGAAGNSRFCLDGPAGGAGGGASLLRGLSLRITGEVRADGETPLPIAAPLDNTCIEAYRPGGGGGAGGSIVLSAPSIDVAPSAFLSARGGNGGDSLGATIEGIVGIGAWAGGGGGGGRIKRFGLGQDVEGSLDVIGGVGGSVPLPNDPDSFLGEAGNMGTLHMSPTQPMSLQWQSCLLPAKSVN